MRIFKNRGDIYFSKTNKEKSEEQKILIISLIAIVAFTIIFLIIVGAKNDFSIKKFFEPSNLSTTQVTQEETVSLPQVTGKTNYIVTVASDENLLFCELVQVDLDNVSYKICSLKSSTEVDGSTLGYIYSNSGAENVSSAVQSLFDCEIDYYIDMQSDDFADFFDTLGEVEYAVASDIKYKNNDIAVPFTLRLKEGEQTVKGSQAVNLVRYYLDVKKNETAANDFLLTALSKQINSDNYEKRDELFQKFVSCADTNITVRNYSAASDGITVLCNSQNGVSVYNAEIKYKKNKITDKTLQQAKGYFKK